MKGRISQCLRKIATIVRAKEIYSRQTSIRHFSVLRPELSKMMENYRVMEVASMESYARLLRELGHTVEIFKWKAFEMRGIRIKEARFIFNQLRK